MLYILRLTDGDCVVTLASDEQGAREAAQKLTYDEATTVASVRPLDNFSVRFCPTEDGSLQAEEWSGCALDGILAAEYPLLYGAYCKANAIPFTQRAESDEPILMHLEAEFERNTEMIRSSLVLERQRFKTKSAGNP
jgi:hypothetical protein